MDRARVPVFSRPAVFRSTLLAAALMLPTGASAQDRALEMEVVREFLALELAGWRLPDPVESCLTELSLRRLEPMAFGSTEMIDQPELVDPPGPHYRIVRIEPEGGDRRRRLARVEWLLPGADGNAPDRTRLLRLCHQRCRRRPRHRLDGARADAAGRPPRVLRLAHPRPRRPDGEVLALSHARLVLQACPCPRGRRGSRRAGAGPEAAGRPRAGARRRLLAQHQRRGVRAAGRGLCGGVPAPRRAARDPVRRAARNRRHLRAVGGPVPAEPGDRLDAGQRCRIGPRIRRPLPGDAARLPRRRHQPERHHRFRPRPVPQERLQRAPARDRYLGRRHQQFRPAGAECARRRGARGHHRQRPAHPHRGFGARRIFPPERGRRRGRVRHRRRGLRILRAGDPQQADPRDRRRAEEFTIELAQAGFSR